jgi:hypothetical protein
MLYVGEDRVFRLLLLRLVHHHVLQALYFFSHSGVHFFEVTFHLHKLRVVERIFSATIINK